METVAADINYSMARMLLCNTSPILNDHKWAQPWFSPHPENTPSCSLVLGHCVAAADKGKSMNGSSNVHHQTTSCCFCSQLQASYGQCLYF